MNEADCKKNLCETAVVFHEKGIKAFAGQTFARIFGDDEQKEKGTDPAKDSNNHVEHTPIIVSFNIASV